MKFKKKWIIISVSFLIIILVTAFSFDPRKNYEEYHFSKKDIDYTDSLVYNFDTMISLFIKNKTFDDSLGKILKKNFLYQDVKNLVLSEYQEKRYLETFYSISILDTISIDLNFKDEREYSFYFWLKKGTEKNIRVVVDGRDIELEPYYTTKFSNEFCIKFKTSSKIKFINKSSSKSDLLLISKPQLFTRIDRKPKHLLWTVIDALRQDIFEDKYKNIIPTLFAFSREEQWYERATNSANWTRPSTVSFLTGKYVKNISKTYSTDTFPIDSASNSFFYKNMEESAATLFNNLKFDVISIINNVFLHDRSVGYELGFPMQVVCNSDIEDEETLSNALLSYIEAHANRDLFIFFNTNTCHARYRCDAHNYFKALGNLPLHFPSSMTKYYGSAAVADEMITHIFDNLKDLGLYDNMKMVLHSDHGELLRGETYYFKNNKKMYFKRHGGYMMPQVFNVPLIFKGFDFSEDENKIVSLVDIVPSLNEYYNAPVRSNYDGTSLEKEIPDRSYFITGDSQFGYINQNFVYEAYSDRLFRFTKERNNMYPVKTKYLLERDSIRGIYFKDYLSINHLALFNLNINIHSTKNLNEVDIVKYKSKTYRAFEVKGFPFSVVTNEIWVNSQKTGKKLFSNELNNVTVQFFQKNVQEAYIDMNSEKDFFFKTYTTVGIRTANEKMDSDLRDQLQKWGYIQ
jgi:hypothetical protein